MNKVIGNGTVNPISVVIQSTMAQWKNKNAAGDGFQ